jgi:hypothetical protein
MAKRAVETESKETQKLTCLTAGWAYWADFGTGGLSLATANCLSIEYNIRGLLVANYLMFD